VEESKLNRGDIQRKGQKCVFAEPRQAPGDAGGSTILPVAALQSDCTSVDFWWLHCNRAVHHRNAPRTQTQLWSNLAPEKLCQPEPNQGYL